MARLHNSNALDMHALIHHVIHKLGHGAVEKTHELTHEHPEKPTLHDMFVKIKRKLEQPTVVKTAGAADLAKLIASKVGSKSKALGLRTLGYLSRVGALPIKATGRAVELGGRAVGTVAPETGVKIMRAGQKTHAYGRAARLAGKVMRRQGKRIGKGLDPNKMPGRPIVGVWEHPKARTNLYNLKRVARAFGVADPQKLSAKDIAKVLAPAGVGAATLGGAYAVTRSGKPKEEEYVLTGEGEEKKGEDFTIGMGEGGHGGSSEFPRREGFKTTNRQDVFDELSQWSLGAKM